MYKSFKELPHVPIVELDWPKSYSELKCPCCHTKGNLEVDGLGGLRCRSSGFYYNKSQMKEIQGTGWVGEEEQSKEVK